MNKKLMTLAALGSAGLASICCIGPLVLAGLGAGSLGLAAGLTRYRPLFLGLTGVILAAAFYFVYRKREVACADGSCKTDGAGPKAKAALWVITVAAAGFMSAPYWLAALNCGGKSSAVQLTPGTYQMVALNIEGMTCNACAVSIEKALRKVPGVKTAAVDFDKSEARVALDHGIDVQLLVKAVEDTGYKATPKK